MNIPGDSGEVSGSPIRGAAHDGYVGSGAPEVGPSVNAASTGADALHGRIPGLLAKLSELEDAHVKRREREGDCFVETEHSKSAARLLADARAIVSGPSRGEDWTESEVRTLRTVLDDAEIADARHELVTNETRIERKRGESPWNRLSIKFMDGSIAYLSGVEFFKKPPAFLDRAVNATSSAIRQAFASTRGVEVAVTEPIQLADIFRRVGLVFEQHGQIAEKHIKDARALHDAEGPMTPERAREICELATKAGKSADAYDKLRTVLLECGVANVMTPIITIALEFVYRWMERHDHPRWDEAATIIASLKEFLPYEGVNLFGYRFPIMGRDMSILNRATRGTLFSELRGSVVESGGNLALSWFFKKKTGVGLEWARFAVAPLIGAAASAESYRKVNPEVKGHLPTSFFAALGAVNGTIRFVPAQFFIKWFFPKVPSHAEQVHFSAPVFNFTVPHLGHA